MQEDIRLFAEHFFCSSRKLFSVIDRQYCPESVK